MTANPANRNFDLIVFDWDGTLFDSTALITRCIQAACGDLGVAVPSDRDASYVIGMGLAEALQHAAPALPRERTATSPTVIGTTCLLYTSPSPRDGLLSRMPSSA